MALLIIRHGETVDNVGRIFQTPDSPLSSDGELQAALLAERMKDFNVSSIVCSDYYRTQQTASYVANTLSLEPSLSPLLRERNFGDLRGQSHSSIEGDPFAMDYQPKNGESWQVFCQRVVKTWQQILEIENTLDGDLAVITHGFVCRAIVENHAHLIDGAELPSHWGNTSITKINSSNYNIELLNSTEHLTGKLQSKGGAV